MNPTTQTLLRAVLKIGAGYLMAHGLADESTVELLSSAGIAAAGLVWGILHGHKETMAKQAADDRLAVVLKDE